MRSLWSTGCTPATGRTLSISWLPKPLKPFSIKEMRVSMRRNRGCRNRGLACKGLNAPFHQVNCRDLRRMAYRARHRDLKQFRQFSSLPIPSKVLTMPAILTT